MPRSVTISGRETPCTRRCSATSLREPGPKGIVVGKANRDRVIEWAIVQVARRRSRRSVVRARRSAAARRRCPGAWPRSTCAGRAGLATAQQNARPWSRTLASYDLEIALQFPIGHRVEPLPPLPFPRRREVLDEVVAKPVASELRV